MSELIIAGLFALIWLYGVVLLKQRLTETRGTNQHG